MRLAERLLDPDAFVMGAAVLKTHNVAVVTLSMKNMVLGAPLHNAPKETLRWNDKRRYHVGIRQSVYNLFLTAQKLQPNWGATIIDGFEGMEGNGPSSGTPVPSRIAIASTDYVAADRVGVEAMGIDPNWLAMQKYSGEVGLGQWDLSKIDIKGAQIAAVQKKYRMHSDIELELKWMGPIRVIPFLNSAVDTTMRSGPFPSLSLESERLLEALPGAGMAQVATEQTQEDLRRLVDQPLLEAERAEAQRRERVVGQQLLERGTLRDGSAGSQHVQQRSRLTIARIQAHRVLQVADRVCQSAGPPIQVAGQPMCLRLVRAGLEDGPNFAHGSFRVTVVQQGLGQDQARRDVLGEPLEAPPAELDGVAAPPRFSIGVGQGREGQRRGIFGQSVLVSTDRAEGSRIIGRQGPTDRRDRVSHPPFVIRGRAC